MRWLLVSLVVVTVAALSVPGPTSAQARPHLFIGASILDDSGALLDALPAPAGRVVVATNQDGVEVGRDTIDEASAWAIAIDPVFSTEVTFTVLGAEGGAGPLPVEVGGHTIVALAVTTLDPAPTRAVILREGWNLVGWTGATAAADAIASIADEVNVVFRWDAGGQRFLSFSPTAPPFLNSLDDLDFGDGVWIQVAAGVVWTQPAIVVARAVALSEGWNLVQWTGPDGTFVADAVGPFIDRVEALFTWNANSQRFHSYSPSAPAFLNTADVLNAGDGVWIRLSGAATWDQPAP